ncbi:zinc-binding oxidoreductase [Bisporella sp. PMI_857]|nr:zinc-binding oxidoreductase [Bisporella sp. PMI_857]
MASMMKAWQYTTIEDTLEKSIYLTQTIPMPTKLSLSKDQILVKVLSAALNPVDIKLPESSIASFMVKPPATPGLDFCGRVVEVHDSNSTFKSGELVFGAFSRAAKQGTLGQYITISSSECAPLPKGVKVDDAAAIGMAGVTAYLSLLPDVVKPGAKVFINGGSGGVGTWAIQFAKIRGAKVTATCSTGNVELCKSLGAEKVLDYKEVDIVSELEKSGPGYDFFVDNAGSPAGLYERSDRFLKKDGAFMQVATAMTPKAMGTVARRMMLPRVLGGGPRRFHFVQTKSTRRDLEQIGTWMAEGKVRSVIDNVFRFEDVPVAFGKLREGRTKGKIIVHVDKE